MARGRYPEVIPWTGLSTLVHVDADFVGRLFLTFHLALQLVDAIGGVRTTRVLGRETRTLGWSVRAEQLVEASQ